MKRQKTLKKSKKILKKNLQKDEIVKIFKIC